MEEKNALQKQTCRQNKRLIIWGTEPGARAWMCRSPGLVPLNSSDSVALPCLPNFFFFFQPHPWHAEVLGPEIEPRPQQQQHQILNPLRDQGTPSPRCFRQNKNKQTRKSSFLLDSILLMSPQVNMSQPLKIPLLGIHPPAYFCVQEPIPQYSSCPTGASAPPGHLLSQPLEDKLQVHTCQFSF